jgi:hypothetical protein
LAAAPAAARKRVHVLAYTITDATMSEEMDFQGDGGPACARAGVCGYSGTVSYGFGGIQDGDLAIAFAPHGHRLAASGVGEIVANGLTKATVNGPGDGPPCTEQVIHRGEIFDLTGTSGRVRLSFHDPRIAGGYLRSFCVGPSDADMWHAHALPRLSVPVSALRHEHVLLQSSTTRAFHSGPFIGTLKFSVSIRMRRANVPSFLFPL